MKHLLALCALALTAAQAQTTTKQIPAGVAAAHMIGRMVLGADGAAELIGEFPAPASQPGYQSSSRT